MGIITWDVLIALVCSLIPFHIWVGHKERDWHLPAQHRGLVVVERWGHIFNCLRVTINSDIFPLIDLLCRDLEELFMREDMSLQIMLLGILGHDVVESWLRPVKECGLAMCDMVGVFSMGRSMSMLLLLSSSGWLIGRRWRVALYYFEEVIGEGASRGNLQEWLQQRHPTQPSQQVSAVVGFVVKMSCHVFCTTFIVGWCGGGDSGGSGGSRNIVNLLAKF